jgi:mannose-6-phosphate isomerase-like protein (cupin superfamily)
MAIPVGNLHDAELWSEVLHTTKLSQSAVMTLKPGDESSEAMNTHESSDQVVLVISGEVEAEMGGMKRKLKQGDTCIIPAGTPHRLANPGTKPALTFSVYAPPVYPPHEKG